MVFPKSPSTRHKNATSEFRKERDTRLTNLIPFFAVGIAAAGATEIPTRLIENHSVGLPTLCSIVVVVAGAGLWLEHRLTRIEDRLDGLPCQKNGCPKRKRRK